MNVITRNVPATYELKRITFELDDDDNIQATADMTVRNVDGLVIDDDHPDTTLTAGERAAFVAWILGQLADYETATGLSRYVPPTEE